MKRGLFFILICFGVLWVGAIARAQRPIELRFLCFNQRNECDVYGDLLARFSQENPGITVAVEVAGQADIEAHLNERIESGAAPDIARIADFDALAATNEPEAVASVLEYLAQPEIYAEFSARTLTIPAQLEVAASPIDYDTESETINAAMNVFARETPKLQDQAIALDLHPLAAVYYEASNTNLRAYFAGELTLDEALGNLKARLAEAGDA